MIKLSNFLFINKISLLKKNIISYVTILIMLLVIVILSISGIKNIEKSVHHDINNNKIEKQFLQIEIDHLKWLSKVEKSLIDKKTKLDVQTNHQLCNFGKWYYSDDLKYIEKEIPDLHDILVKFEEPHKLLHGSAIEISKLMEEGDFEQAFNIFEEQSEYNLNILLHLFKEANEIIGHNSETSEKHLFHVAKSLVQKIIIISFIILLMSVLFAVVITSSIVKPIFNTKNMLEYIVSNGDLTKRLEVETKDEVGDLINWFNIFIDKIYEIIKIEMVNYFNCSIIIYWCDFC